jgi:hypothetical protein
LSSVLASLAPLLQPQQQQQQQAPQHQDPSPYHLHQQQQQQPPKPPPGLMSVRLIVGPQQVAALTRGGRDRLAHVREMSGASARLVVPTDAAAAAAGDREVEITGTQAQCSQAQQLVQVLVQQQP